MLSTNNVCILPPHSRRLDSTNKWGFDHMIEIFKGRNGLIDKLKDWGVTSKNSANYQAELKILSDTSLCAQQTASLSHLYSLICDDKKMEQLTLDEEMFLWKRGLDGCQQLDCGERFSVYDYCDKLAKKDRSNCTFTGFSVDDVTSKTTRMTKYLDRLKGLPGEHKRVKQSKQLLAGLMESIITPFGESLKKKIHFKIDDYKVSQLEIYQDRKKAKTTFFDGDGNERAFTAKNLQEFFYDPLILFTPTVPIFDSDEKWLQYCKLYPKRSRNGQAIIQPDFQKRLQSLCGKPRFVAYYESIR